MFQKLNKITNTLTHIPLYIIIIIITQQSTIMIVRFFSLFFFVIENKNKNIRNLFSFESNDYHLFKKRKNYNLLL